MEAYLLAIARLTRLVIGEQFASFSGGLQEMFAAHNIIHAHASITPASVPSQTSGQIKVRALHCKLYIIFYFLSRTGLV